MTAYPWMKFFPADWRSDPKLRMCSIAARGFWMECLCLMHEADPYGHLIINRKAPSDPQLAALTGTDPSTVRTLLSELEEAGVFSRNRAGVIYSRRMVADEKMAVLARKNGKKGGNPSLCNQTQNPPPDNPPDKGYVNGGDKTQTPDVRQQKVEENSEPSPTINQSAFTGPVGPGKTVGFVGKSFALNEREFAELRSLYFAVPDFTAALKTHDAELEGYSRPKALAALRAKLLHSHNWHLARNAGKQTAQPAQRSNRGKIVL